MFLPQPPPSALLLRPGNLATSVPAGREASPPEVERPATAGELLPYFLAYLAHERNYAQTTIRSYYRDILWVIRTLGDIRPGTIRQEHVLALKMQFARRGVGPARIRRLINGLKAFLTFCRLTVGIETLDPASIRGPKLPKRDVVFLIPEEIRKFLAAIPLYSRQRGRRVLNLRWLCFRTVIEVLRGTGMRISEALSLKHSSLDFARGQAQVVGKGNKERTIYFSPTSLAWLKEYLNRCPRNGDLLFVWPNGRPIHPKAIQQRAKHIALRTGITKKVTPHIIRHTFATTLLMNGAPIGIIKVLLGHDQLQTTCNFYLGVDKRLAKSTLERYLNYDYDRDIPPDSAPAAPDVPPGGRYSGYHPASTPLVLDA